jgi:hypothetical protein
MNRRLFEKKLRNCFKVSEDYKVWYIPFIQIANHYCKWDVLHPIYNFPTMTPLYSIYNHISVLINIDKFFTGVCHECKTVFVATPNWIECSNTDNKKV